MVHTERTIYVDPKPGDLIITSCMFYPWSLDGNKMSYVLDKSVGVVVSTTKLDLTHPCRRVIQGQAGSQFVLDDAWVIVMFDALLCLAPVSYLSTLN